MSTKLEAPADWRALFKQHFDGTAPARPESDAPLTVPVIRETTEEEISALLEELEALIKPTN